MVLPGRPAGLVLTARPALSQLLSAQILIVFESILGLSLPGPFPMKELPTLYLYCLHGPGGISEPLLRGRGRACGLLLSRGLVGMIGSGLLSLLFLNPEVQSGCLRTRAETCPKRALQ